MREFKTLFIQQQQLDTYPIWVSTRAKEANLDGPDALVSRVLTMEQSLGTLLRCALEHIESVQTTDMPELIGLVEQVLAASCQRQPGHVNFERTQELMVLKYLESVAVRIDSFEESKVRVERANSACGVRGAECGVRSAEGSVGGGK